MVNVIAKADIKLENIDKAIELYRELAKATRKEEGCIKYDIIQNLQDKNFLIVVEEWESEGYLKAHFNTEHFVRLVPEIGKLANVKSEVHVCKKII